VTILLSKNNFCEEIVSFHDAREALNHLAIHSHDFLFLPDVILLDLNMPTLDGWQFLEAFELLQIKKKIAIFILSSSIDPADVELTKKYEFVKNYLMKPITTSKLEEVKMLL
jgi:CheY-like chemotaxis protein